MMVAGGAKTGEEMSPELVVVIPVYNEQASLRKVIREWYLEIENWTEDFVILVMNDGSTDRSPDIVERLQEQLGDRIRLHTHTNRGHGLTCLVGYERALELGARYVFQIDSDGQCDPQYFFRVWRQRDQSQVVYGWRKARDDGWRRVLASRLLRMVQRTRGTPEGDPRRSHQHRAGSVVETDVGHAWDGPDQVPRTVRRGTERWSRSVRREGGGTRPSTSRDDVICGRRHSGR
jgi:dolichol-phosphate mannosyltransferase